MKKRHIVLKSLLIISAVLLAAGILFSVLILEPKVKINGWADLDVNKLNASEHIINLLDENDNPIENPIYDNNKMYTSLEDIPRHTLDAFISIEDRRFYEHSGVDYKRIFAAIAKNITSLSFKEGASTISQQLIKNTHLSSDKKISRKIQEIRIAKELERKFSKDEIIEMYVNILYFGSNMYGIATAARALFDVNVSDLSVSQSALLAGIINNPSKFNPYTNTDNAISRRNLVLKCMLDSNKIDSDAYEAAFSEPLKLADKTPFSQYNNSVICDAQFFLKCSRENLFKKELTIGTNYRQDLQDFLGKSLRTAQVPSGIDAHIVVIENFTGKVVSDANLSNSNLSSLRRQPGSAIKPMLCFAPALENKSIYPVSPIFDEDISFGDYSPKNHNNKYYGWTSIEQALCRSLNIPAVKLLEKNGIGYSKSICEKAGLDFSKDDNHLAIALGGMSKGVTLRQIVDSYSVFARSGDYIRGNTIRYIKDKNGRILYENVNLKRNVLSEDSAYLMTSMLKNCAKTGTAKKLNAFENVCAKTGTVGDKTGNTDAYCIAYSPQYSVGVWMGAQKGKMPNSITGAGLPSSIAASVFENLGDVTYFKKPDSVVWLDIDSRELHENHLVLRAGSDIAYKDKITALFSLKNIPPYSTPQVPDYFSYDDLLGLDPDNFKII